MFLHLNKQKVHLKDFTFCYFSEDVLRIFFLDRPDAALQHHELAHLVHCLQFFFYYYYKLFFFLRFYIDITLHLVFAAIR